MAVPAEASELSGEQVGSLIAGTAFVLFGLGACTVAMLRRGGGSGVRALAWLAVWSGVYGLRTLLSTSALTASLPDFARPAVPYLELAAGYSLVLCAMPFWLELVRDPVRRIVKAAIWAGSAIAAAGVGWFIVTKSGEPFTTIMHVFVVCAVVVLLAVGISASRSKLYVAPPVLIVGLLIFGAEGLFSNLARALGYAPSPILDHLGFAVLLLSLTVIAAQVMFANEKRLMAIDGELETARKIQTSILPEGVPGIDGLNVAAAYQPATSVAGDFYDFVRISDHEAGFLVADVSGHGVPPALIASMVKVAMQSVADSGRHPAEVLCRLHKILRGSLKEQFLTAAYLCVDARAGVALYSAAGHPPMLYWDSAAQQVRFIESNGPLLGVFEEVEFPVRGLKPTRGDRFLLYTDGITEARNDAGEMFGEQRLGELIRSCEKLAANAVSDRLRNAVTQWQGSPTATDDMTWIVCRSS